MVQERLRALNTGAREMTEERRVRRQYERRGRQMDSARIALEGGLLQGEMGQETSESRD